MERNTQGATISDTEPSSFEGKDKKFEEPTQPPSPNALKVAATECLNSWIYYLQMLNSLCSAGLRLSQAFTTLAQMQNISLASQCLASWDELAKSTIVASHTVKTHIAAAMQDMMIGETFTEEDAQRQQEHNQQIITETIFTFINLQYQFSLAGCECLGGMAMCPSCQTTAGGVHDPECSMATLQQCFAQLGGPDIHSSMSSPHLTSEKGILDSPKSQEIPRPHPPEQHPRQHSPLSQNPEPPRGSSPYNEPIRGTSPIGAFADMIRGAGHIESIRGPLPNPGQLHTMKSPFPSRGSRSPLHFPLFPLSGQRRWSEAAAGDVGSDTGDSTMRRWSMPWDCGRVEAAPWQQRYLPSKLAVPGTSSQERSRSATPDASPQPGTITSGEGLAEAIQLLSCRPTRCVIPHSPYSGPAYPGYPSMVWSDSHEERIHRRMYGSHMQRGNWQSIDVPSTSGIQGADHFDIFPQGFPLTSRKSSSSTDSSSCLSIHSRSTSSSERGSEGYAGGDALRMHQNFYSMWSGNEHLPFIRLPESQEPQDDSDTEDTPTESKTYPKPT
nr:uncharacterized protein LOC111417364 [Onthophagus taurus]